MMELVDMNSLGLFDFLILSVQVGFTLNISFIFCSVRVIRSKKKYTCNDK
jgi:hypothetical protein